MDSNNQNKCTICSKDFSSGERISVDENLLHLFKFLVCRLNSTILENTPICETCSGNIQKACEFKLLFLEAVNQDRAVSRIRKETEPDLLKCQICEKDINKCLSVTYTTESKFIIDYYLSRGSNFEANHSCDSCKESILNLHSVTILFSNFENDPNNEDLRVPVESTNKENKRKNVEEPSEEVKIENNSSTAYENFLLKNEELNIKIEEYEENLTDEEASGHSNEDNDVLQCGDIQGMNNQLCEYQTQDKLTCTVTRQICINTETYKCNVCKFKTKDNITSERYTLTHQKNDKNKLHCDVFGYKTKHKNSFKRHLLAHKNINKTELFNLDVCGFKTMLKENLKRHLLIHRNVDEIEIFECDICGFKTKHKNSHKRHLLTHKNISKTELFNCDVCGFKTRLKENLKKHLLIHRNVDEIEIFECDICGFKTKHKNSLKRHFLIHRNVDEIQMFKCDVCGFKTNWKKSLQTHMIVHKNVDKIKIFECDLRIKKHIVRYNKSAVAVDNII